MTGYELESQATYCSIDSLPDSSTAKHPRTSAQAGEQEPASHLLSPSERAPPLLRPQVLLPAAFTPHTSPSSCQDGGHQDEGGTLRDAQRRLPGTPRGRAFLALQPVPPVHEAAAGLR